MAEWKTAGVAGDTWDKSEPVQGVYLRKEENVGPNKSNIYVLKTKTGDTTVWGGTVIDSRFQEIPTGAEVRITSLGVTTGKTGKEYNDFKVEYREVPMTDTSDEQTLKDIGLL